MSTGRPPRDPFRVRQGVRGAPLRTENGGGVAIGSLGAA